MWSAFTFSGPCDTEKHREYMAGDGIELPAGSLVQILRGEDVGQMIQTVPSVMDIINIFLRLYPSPTPF